MRKFLCERTRSEFSLLSVRDSAQESDFLFWELRQISVELSLFETAGDNWPELTCVRELLSAVEAPEFAADECNEIRMAKRFALKPFCQLLMIKTGTAKYRADEFGRLFKTEWLQRALVVEANGRFSETTDARKIIGLSTETDAEVDTLDSEKLKLVPHY